MYKGHIGFFLNVHEGPNNNKNKIKNKKEWF